MEITLAKPLSDKRKQAQVKREQRKQFDSNVPTGTNFVEHSTFVNRSEPATSHVHGLNNNSTRGRRRSENGFST
jgi:hypothetical protein